MSDTIQNSSKRRLSDTQLIALSSAPQREDGAVSLPDRIKGAAAVNLVASLIAKGLVREGPCGWRPLHPFGGRGSRKGRSNRRVGPE
jgi:hypothetical protein